MAHKSEQNIHDIARLVEELIKVDPTHRPHIDPWPKATDFVTQTARMSSIGELRKVIKGKVQRKTQLIWIAPPFRIKVGGCYLGGAGELCYSKGASWL